jgi:hypothetical protein
MTDKRFTKFATEAMTKKPEAVAGMITRLAANAVTMPPEEQLAFMEFFNALGGLIPEPEQKQGAPGVLGGQ